MPYIPNTREDVRSMLDAVDCVDIDELWGKTGISLPKPPLDDIPEGKSEHEVTRHLRSLAALNATNLVSFLGSGYYDHIIPAAVSDIASRSEFLTAYTPYQPEASQGTLQTIYEYQCAVCRLTGMEVSNASMYDGGTALFEAMMLAVRATRKRRAVISGAVSPIFREMIRCYGSNLDVELVEVPSGDTDSSQQALIDAVDGNTACLLVQYPNVFGTVEDWSATTAAVKGKGAVAVCSAYPIALALLTPPGKMGFDVVTGEGQSLGLPLSFGGPYLGFMATTMKLARKMPGRIVGKTTDASDREGFVLTLQTREQHIRRENATSNICTNENLCALTALAYLTCLGKSGFLKVGELCAAKAVYARNLLLAIDGVEAVGDEPFFNEFVVRLPMDAAELVGRMIDKGFAAGFPLGRYYPERGRELLVAVTEKRSKEEIKAFANAMEAAITA